MTAVFAIPTQIFVPDTVTASQLFVAILRILSLGALAAAVSGLVAVVYRWYTREGVPDGVALLLGIGAVALVLNTEETLASTTSIDTISAATTVISILVSGIGADLGRRGGDAFAANAFAVTGAAKLDREVSQLVRAVGRAVTVTLPDEVEDIDGYDPVDPKTKESLAETTFVFPRRITVAELRDRIVSRLKDDYGVGHVDIEVAEDGTVSYLAVGSRAAGLGPTLAPGTVAVAIEADPAYAASPGDVVQVWEHTEDGLQRRATGELRATRGDVVTLAVDETDAEALSDSTQYRLVTLPAEPSADREFASLLRVADETMGAVAIDEGSPLADLTVGALDVTVAAIRSSDGTVTATPSRNTPLPAGTTVYVIARPDELRTFETAARAAADTGPHQQAETLS
ncbi:TrkA C-terminal domain-containing protein [Haloarchaeobius sp. DT45]|uniref:TrkA C-terminal domain-containing protein n=1 Tax=Haloarchaeobius sp. DT45 TaxID=3446116 RepID=UPI003F6B38FB